MEFSGKYLFLCPRDQLWAGLNDAQMLGGAIPGCESIEWTGDTTLDVAIKVNLGVMHPVFKGGLELSNVDEARAYTLTGTGKGALLGFAKGVARISLEDDERGTIMTMRAEGEASSAIMAMGSKFLGNAAQGVIDRFFQRFAGAMGVEIQVLDIAA